MWSNWTGNVVSHPERSAAARSRDAVRAAVAEAAAAGRTVRAVGAGHSFSEITRTDGTLLHLGALRRVLDHDRATGQVRVEAGITLHDLSRELLARGLAFPNLGDIDVQSLAGALATGTHGTGARLGNISTTVKALELVLDEGEERTLAEEDGDLLRAARVSMGSLGVVVAATLECVPAFRLHGVDAPMPLDEVLASLDEHVKSNDHFEFWTFPHSPVAITRTNNRTDAPLSPMGRGREWLEEVLLDNHAFHALNLVATRFPRAIPRINRLAGAVSSRRERVDWSFRIFASPRLVRFVEMEYAIPRAHATEALLGLREILERHPVSFPIELRFVAADDALLSPAHDRETAYLAIHVFHRMDIEGPFREAEAFLAQFGGRPHWGKRSFLGAAELATRYPRWDAFAAARAELDPRGRFASTWTEHALGRLGEGGGDPIRGTSAPRRGTSGPTR